MLHDPSASPIFTEEELVAVTAARVRQKGPSTLTAVSIDALGLVEGCLFVAHRAEKADTHDFLRDVSEFGAAAAVVERGGRLPPLPSTFGVYEVEDPIAALRALASFHRSRFRIPVGAVTGSSGKTSVNEMVGSILRTRGPALTTEGNSNNHIGVAMTLLGLRSQHRAAVLEMGMDHPGEIRGLAELALPDAGVITAVHAAHLEGVGSLAGVAAAKGELFHALRGRGTAVVNLDEPLIVAQARASGAATLTFGSSPDADVRLAETRALGRQGLEVLFRYDGRNFPVKLAFVGAHNGANAAAAFALGIALGCRPEECAAGLEGARPPPQRLELLSAEGEVTVIDDCYNANPGSMAAALAALCSLDAGGRAVAVLGDMLELGAAEKEEHRRVGHLARQAAGLVAFFGPRMAEAHGTAALGDRGAHFIELEPLLDWLRPRLGPGDHVLVKGSRHMRLERVVDALVGRRRRRRG